MSCPTCGKPTDPKFRPFCSQRCKELDLLRWLNGNYRIPVVEEEPAEEEIDGGHGVNDNGNEPEEN